MVPGLEARVRLGTGRRADSRPAWSRHRPGWLSLPNVPLLCDLVALCPSCPTTLKDKPAPGHCELLFWFQETCFLYRCAQLTFQ